MEQQHLFHVIWGMGMDAELHEQFLNIGKKNWDRIQNLIKTSVETTWVLALTQDQVPMEVLLHRLVEGVDLPHSRLAVVVPAVK